MTFVRALWIVALVLGPQTAWAQPSTSRDVVRLPPTIPLFPLEDVMLLPKVSRAFHIFEPRYRSMVADALKGDRIIGMVMLRPGYEKDYEGRPPVHPVGCAAVITEAEELPDGRFFIALRGFTTFRIHAEDQSRVYRIASVEGIAETVNEDEQIRLRQQREQLLSLLTLAKPGFRPPPPSLPDEYVVNSLALYLEMPPADRQRLLEHRGPLLRSRALIGLLEATAAPPR